VLVVVALLPAMGQLVLALSPAGLPTAARADDESERRQRAEFATLRRTRDAELRKRLIEGNLPLAWFVARRFVKRGEPPEDVRQVATVALILAVDRYDPGQGPAFAAFAAPTIAGELKRYLRDSSWRWHVPRPVADLSLAVGALIDRLSQAFGRSPTIGELAEASGASPDEVAEALTYTNQYPRLHGTEDEPHADVGLEERLGAVDPSVDWVDMRWSVEPLLRRLPPTERTLLYLRFFKGLTQHEIAQRMGVSQMQVSRQLARTLARLRAQLHDRDPAA
jgi:RNA polymerase sigma-B factor